jgi:glycosyltransferase involved in cell wall biosynthesis
MINGKTVAVVVPCFNEQSQIGMVIESMPDFVDRIIIVNDKSTDSTEQVVQQYINSDKSNVIPIHNILDTIKPNKYNRANIVIQDIQKNELVKFIPSRVYNANQEQSRIILINQLKNGGVGSVIARGYKWAKDHGIDCTAVMAGDGQMDPDELESICRPVIDEGIDYVKGNRLIHRSALLVIPKVRFLGNSILSILTKIASGYWHVSDTQTGYTAIGNKALNAIRIHEIYRSYGMPNDILVKLNIAFCTLREVEIKPIYGVGEKSKMKILKVIPRVSILLLSSFFKRLWLKYLFRDFHPYFIKVTSAIIKGNNLSFESLFAFTFLGITSIQSLLFAMWMDIQDNERLYK